MKKFRPVVVFAVFVASALVVCGTVALVFSSLANRHRSNAFNDSDLIPTRMKVPAQSNAFLVLLQATNKLYWPPLLERKLDNLSDNTNWDDTLATEVLDKNRACLDLFDQAMQKPFLQVPEPKTFDQEYPYLRDWRDIGQLESIRTIALFRTGKEEAAFDEAFKILHFGQGVENCGGPSLHYLVGAGIKSVGLARIRQMAAQTTLNGTELLQFIRRLNNFGPNKEGLTNAIKIEYQMDCRFLDDFAAGKMTATNSDEQIMMSHGIRHFFSAKETKGKIAQADRILLQSVSKPFGEVQWAKLPVANTNDSFLSFISQMIKGNLMGNVFFEMFEIPVKSYAKIKSREDVNVTATQLLLALRVYKMQHGRLPESLSKLVPEFFSHVPIDDFDGKPFRYLPDKMRWTPKTGPQVKMDIRRSAGEKKADYESKTETA